MDVLSSITLNITSCCLLASIVSDEKSAFNLIESLLYMMNHFLSCCFQGSFFLQLSALNLSVNFFCSSSYFEFFWLLGCVDQSFSLTLGSFQLPFLQMFFLSLSFSGALIMHILVSLMVSLWSLILCLLHYFFSFSSV